MKLTVNKMSLELYQIANIDEIRYFILQEPRQFLKYVQNSKY